MSNSLRVIVVGVVLAVPLLLVQAAPVDVDGDGIVGPQEVIDLSLGWKGPALPLGGVQPWQVNGTSIFYNAGNVGIGTNTPHHRLRVSGGPLWTSNQWAGSLELDNGAAIGWPANDAGKRFGIGHSFGGLYFFNTDSDPGTETSEAQYAMTITDTGAVGIGTTTPGAKFQVNDGRIRVRDTATGNRWDMFQHDNGNLFFIEQNATYRNFMIVGGPEGRVGIGTDSPAAGTKLHVFNPSQNGIGVYGEANGSSAYGVYGKTNIGFGVYGIGDTGYGVYGTSPGGIGVAGKSTSNIGVEGTSTDYWGVSGVSTNNIGVSGSSAQFTGVDGYSGTGNGVKGVGVHTGVRGEGGFGMVAKGTGPSSIGIAASGSYLSGQFTGNVYVFGDVTEQKSTVQIDHPLDPENKVLSHSSVESSEMKNIYDGNVITDATGYAKINLPDWFEALNKDFRYQLTVIDGTDSDDFVQAKVVKKIEGNQFTIRTSQPNVEVSWLVTGVRNDLYAKAHPLEVEKIKPENERGKYLAPELYGQPKERGINYRPEMELSSAPESTGGEKEARP